MKRIILIIAIALVLFDPVALKAQFNNNSDVIIINSGTYVNIKGNLNNFGGTIQNSGTIVLIGNYTNNAFFNSSNYSFVRLEGASQLIGGSNPTTFSTLVVDGTDNKQCNTNTFISQTLLFNNNKIIIGNYNLGLLPSALITGANNSKYIVTNGSGSLIKKSVTSNADFLFPVGDAVTSYKPIILNNSGTVDTFAVRVASGLLPTTGADPSCVQFTYFAEESNPGGSNATLSLGWNTADEGSSFVRTQTYMWQYNNSTWNMLPGTSGALANLPATNWIYNISGITDFTSGASRFVLRTYQILTLLAQDTAQSTCENNTVTFNVAATGSGIQFQWQANCGSGWTSLTDNIIYSGTQSTALIINNPDLGMNGCQYQCLIFNTFDTITSLPSTLSVHSYPTANAGNDTTVLIGNTVQLTATGGFTYQWSPPTYLNNTDIPNPISIPLTNISYLVYVTDQYGCSATDTVNIIVDDATSIFIPNAFSPNNDGQNDVLYVRGNGIKDLLFVIYDRWGEKIFETTDKTIGWDGTYKGKELPTSVFTYYVKAVYYSNEEVVKKGNVTLVK